MSKNRSNARGSAPWRAGWSCWTVVVAIVWAACVGVCVAAPKGTGGIGGGGGGGAVDDVMGEKIRELGKRGNEAYFEGRMGDALVSTLFVRRLNLTC